MALLDDENDATEEPVKKVNFVCRVCGGNEYKEVKVNNGIDGPGYKEWAEYYFCAFCSAIFQDVEKFSHPK